MTSNKSKSHLEIIEPFKPETIEFNCTDDFSAYYNKHKDEFENMTTYKLNVKYKIPGYRITQKKDKEGNIKLMLIKDYMRRLLANGIEEPTNYQNRLNMLEKRIQSIETYLTTFNMN